MMPLYRFRDKGRRMLKPLMGLLLKVHPDVITWISLVFSIIAGICYFRSDLHWTLIAGIILLLLRMGCNLLDGMIARERGIASTKGEALAESIDRFADVFILLGIIFSPYASLKLGIIALALMLLSSYLGILKKAVGGKREFGGIMGKVDRLTLIMLFSLIQFFWESSIYKLSLFNLLLILFIIGGSITVFQRGLSIKRGVKR